MAQLKNNSTVNGTITASSFDGVANSTIIMNSTQQADLINACTKYENNGKLLYTELKGMYLANKVFPNKSILTINYNNEGNIENTIAISEFAINNKSISLSSLYVNNTIEFLCVGNNNTIPLFSYLEIPKESIDVHGNCTVEISEVDTTNKKSFVITDGVVSTDYDILIPIEDNKDYEIAFLTDTGDKNTVSKFFIDDEETSTLKTTDTHKGYSCKIVSYKVYNITITQPLIGGKIEVIKDGEVFTEDFTSQYGSNLSLRFTADDNYKISQISIGDTIYTNLDDIPSSISITSDIKISMLCELDVVSLNVRVPKGIEKIVIDGSEYKATDTITLNSGSEHSLEVVASTGYVITGLSGVLSNTYDISKMMQSFSGNFTMDTDNYIEVSVQQLNISLNVIQTIGGNISVNGHTSGSVTIPAGTDFTVGITPETNYKFNYVEIDGVKYYEGNTIPSSVLTATYKDITITANFILIRNVKLNQNNHAKLSIQGYTAESDGSYKIPDGTTVTVIATPEEGYEVTGIEKK